MRQKTLSLALLAVLVGAGCEQKAVEEEDSVKQERETESVGSSDQHHYFHKEEQPHKAEWSYLGETGPANWGNLSPEYVLAKTGRHQSPIDLTEPASTDLPRLKFDYQNAQINLVYNGHTIEEIENQKSRLFIGKKEFVLEQFHFHSPSEHTVDGKHFPMEMHLVHKSPEGEVAVVGVFIDEGESNRAYDTVWNHLPSAANRERSALASVDASYLLPKGREHYAYTGSFTTPPCTEDVQWIVMKETVSLSKTQIEQFRAIIDHNNRPVQPLNGRTISLSD